MTTDARYADLGDTISEVLATRAARQPDHVVVRLPDRDLTFGELDEAANRMAHVLADLGTGPGGHGAVLLPNGADFLTAWFGHGRGGAVEVPLNVGLKGDLLLHQLRTAEARTLVTDATGLHRVAAIADRLDHLRAVVVAGGGDGDGAAVPDLGGIEVVSMNDALAGAPAAHPGVEVDPFAPDGILFTSGTTGPSKGVVRSHRSNRVLAECNMRIMRYEGPERLFTAFPLFHLNAKYNSVYPALLLGGRVVLHDRFSASRFWDICREEEVTAFNFMGALLTMLMKQPPGDGDRDHDVRCAYGAPAPAEIFDDFVSRFGVQLVEVWGMTEIGIATHNTVDEWVVGTCGVAAPYFEVEVHDERGFPVPDGTQGELVVRPTEPGVMFDRYHGMPEATVEAFRGLWFHTGDRGVRDEHGSFRFVDRMKDAIRRRGENISSWEVESVLLDHPGIAEAAVIGVPSELTEEEVLAVLVRAPDAPDLDEVAVLDHCQERLPHFAVPRYVRWLDTLPRTPSQRVEKYRLRADALTDDTWDREAHGYVVAR